MKDNQGIKTISQTTIPTYFHMEKTMMTYSLALWQIAALILLTLLVGGILKRVGILIVLGRSLRWSKLQQSLTDLTSPNLQSKNSSESGSGTIKLAYDPVIPSELDQDYIGSDQHSVNDESCYGPSGFTPGGVSYTQVPMHGGALIPKGRKGFGRKK